ncbi:uncharacterized protein NPIL_699161 [Nephila pilipes]|uniref:Uncharacterized protein n=1 Tax=Nephila pilipes TaxID=299642 RepID=A0A8X6NF17_NEPPI|nr:uncharacterized protein NPIL_699161 [Nephila pilipes]
MLKHNKGKIEETSNSTPTAFKIKICEDNAHKILDVKHLNSTYVQRKRRMPNLLHCFLYLFGLLQTPHNPKQKITLIILMSFMFLIMMDNLGTNVQVMYENSSVWDINSAFFICSILPFASWFAMRLKREHLTKVLQKLEDISSDTFKTKTNCLVIILCLMPLLHSILILATSKNNHYMLSTLYGYAAKEQWAQISILFLKSFFSFLAYPIFNNLIALLYCTLCMRCCVVIEQLTSEVWECPPKTFGASTQIRILTRKEKIDDILDRIQNYFSNSSFFIILANILSCFCILGALLKETPGERQINNIISYVFYSTNSFGSITGILWIAGGVPILLDKFKNEYFKKAHRKMLLTPLPEEPKLEKWLFDKPDFVFTGCDIFSYRRSSLLAVLGTLLTYTFLIISK